MPRLDVAKPLTLFAPAKLNLGLEVLGRRADGFHEIVSILQAVSIFDRIDLLPGTCLTYEPVVGVQRDRDLVWRALRVAEEQLDIALVGEIRLRKVIPTGAGLGGGSSDAGTLLGALAALAGVATPAVEAVAAMIGSDVPFFVRGGTASARGTGAALTPLPDLVRAWFVVVTPDLRILEKTRTLYRELAEQDMRSGGATRALEDLIRAGRPLDPHLLRSSFTRPLLRRAQVWEAVAALRDAGAEVVLPAGAGPSVFAPVRTHGEATMLATSLWDRGCRVRVCTTVRAGLNDGRLAAWSRGQPSPRG